MGYRLDWVLGVALRMGRWALTQCAPRRPSPPPLTKPTAVSLAGTYHAAGDTETRCLDCDSGTFSGPGAQVCRVCRDMPNCDLCAPDTGKCKQCSEGYELDSRLQCTLCSAGYGQQSAGGTCEQCLVGTYRLGPESTPSLSCLPCPAGKYTDTEAQFKCLDCNVGAGFACLGADVSDSGKACAAGKFSSGSGKVTACTNCPVGTFSTVTALTSSTLCSPCSAGLYGATTGLSTPACTGVCDAGKFSGPGESTCSKCSVAAGYYCPAGSQEVGGEACPAGSYSSALGQVATCAGQCPAGTFGADGVVGMTTAADACMDCEVGKYSDTNGLARECKLCPLGTYVSFEGATACALCEPGTYSDGLGSAMCVECTPGCACPQGAKKDCAVPCPTNSFSEAGASACTLCAAGKFSLAQSTSNADCTDCAAGFTSVSGGPCKACNAPPGRWVWVPGCRDVRCRVRSLLGCGPCDCQCCWVLT